MNAVLLLIILATWCLVSVVLSLLIGAAVRLRDQNDLPASCSPRHGQDLRLLM